MLRSTLFLFLCVAASCVSRTVTDERFRDSEAVSAVTIPTVTVPDADHFTFAAVGDLHIAGGDTARFRRILDAASAEGDAFIVLLGDLVDQGVRSDVEAYRKTITDAGWAAKAFSIVGNHDVFYDGWTSYRDLNGPSHYSFTVGNTRFLALDTADGNLGGAQLHWMEDELAKAKSANTFFLSHYLPFIPGQRTYLKLSNDAEAMVALKIAVKFKVRGWLGAHYHSFAVGNAEGVDIVVAGGGGGRRMEPVLDNFFVQVAISGGGATYTLKKVP